MAAVCQDHRVPPPETVPADPLQCSPPRETARPRRRRTEPSRPPPRQTPRPDRRRALPATRSNAATPRSICDSRDSDRPAATSGSRRDAPSAPPRPPRTGAGHPVGLHHHTTSTRGSRAATEYSRSVLCPLRGQISSPQAAIGAGGPRGALPAVRDCPHTCLPLRPRPVRPGDCAQSQGRTRAGRLPGPLRPRIHCHQTLINCASLFCWGQWFTPSGPGRHRAGPAPDKGPERGRSCLTGPSSRSHEPSAPGSSPAVALNHWWRAWTDNDPSTELQDLIGAATTGRGMAPASGFNKPPMARREEPGKPGCAGRLSGIDDLVTDNSRAARHAFRTRRIADFWCCPIFTGSHITQARGKEEE